MRHVKSVSLLKAAALAATMVLSGPHVAHKSVSLIASGAHAIGLHSVASVLGTAGSTPAYSDTALAWGEDEGDSDYEEGGDGEDGGDGSDGGWDGDDGSDDGTGGEDDGGDDGSGDFDGHDDDGGDHDDGHDDDGDHHDGDHDDGWDDHDHDDDGEPPTTVDVPGGPEGPKAEINCVICNRHPVRFVEKVYELNCWWWIYENRKGQKYRFPFALTRSDGHGHFYM